MHILFLTDNFPPEGNAPATRTFEHAIRWVKAGHDVTVITGVPNFPEGILFEGYSNRWYQRETIAGINVVRVKTYITANEGVVRRILDYMSFMVTSFVAGLWVRRPDLVVATSPQFFTAVGGWALAAVRRKPFVFELRDIWPASITAVDAIKKSKIISFLEKVELFLYRRAERIIVVTESFKTELIERGIEGEKIDVILNGVDLNRYEPMPQKDSEFAITYGLEGKFVAGYIGTHGMAHGLEHIVRAATMLADKDDIRIIFAGGGAARAKVERLVEEQGLTNVVLIPRVSKEEMPRLWSLCDVSLVNLRNAPLFKTVIPSKIFESMGMGIPMVVSMPVGEATQLVEQSKSGLIVHSESPEEIAAAIVEFKDDQNMLRDFAANARAAASTYSRDKLAMDAVASFQRATTRAI